MSLPDESDWQQIQRIFEQALEIPEDDRLEFVRQSTNEQKVIKEVAELLDAYDDAAEELEFVSHFDAVSQILEGYQESTTVASLEGYEIQDEIHRGGQGVVYRAVQASTNRLVALKFMHTGPYADEAVKRRFEREVELAGSLRHPGIVRIFDSGLISGQYFYVMEYIEGDRWDAYVANKQLSVRQILNLFVQVCDAVNYAHQRGVIHRDLKPSNILVDDEGQPRIVDFGLAKLDDSTPDETQQISFTGLLMGTLNYMSPEQASGQPDAIDNRSDVYSLAVILYRLITGRLPYELDASLSKNLLTIQDARPFPMRGISQELATIVLKALSKEPDRRYQTAGDFGKDVNRFLRGEMVEAKRDSVLYLVTKTVQRHRLATAVTVSFATLVFVSMIVGWGLYLDAEKARYDESISSLNYLRERDAARNLRDESQRQRYFVEMDLAGRLLGESGGIGRVKEIVTRWQTEPNFPVELRGWEWYYLNSRIDRHVDELQLDELPFCARFSPNGKWIAFGDDVGIVRICPTAEMSDVTQLGRHDSVVRAVSWSSDGQLLASGSVDQQVLVYEVESSKQIWNFSHDDHVVSLQWHPNRPLLASGSNDGVVKIWDTELGTLQREFDAGTGAESLDWSTDGNRLVVGTWGRQARIWDLQKESRSNDLKGYSSVLNAVRWNGKGTMIATGENNGELTVRNIKNRSLVWKLGTRRNIRDLVWSPDSSTLAAVGNDRSIKIWDPFFPTLLRRIEGHSDAVWSIDWSSDGQWLLSSAHDYRLRIWRAKDPEDDRVLRIPTAAPVTSLAWSPDDTRLAVGSELAAVALFDVHDGRLVKRIKAGAKLQSVCWSPDGLRVAAGGWGEKTVIWGIQRGNRIIEFEHVSERPDDGIPNIVNCVAWSPDGEKVASTCYDSTVSVWDSETGDLIESFAEQTGNIYSVDWHPSTPDLLAISTSIHGAWIWALDQQEPRRIDTARNQARCIRWNPEGTRFAIGRDDGLVTIHDAETCEEQLSLKNHLGQVLDVAWHPDGKRLASASEDGTVRIWDATTGTQTISFDRSQGPMTSVAWSHDGRSLAAAGQQGIVQILNATTGYERAAGSMQPAPPQPVVNQPDSAASELAD